MELWPLMQIPQLRISACLADISSWMSAHRTKLNPSKTKLLVIPGDSSPDLSLNAIRPLQMIQNAAALTFKAKTIPAPSNLRNLITPCTAPRCLRSSSISRLVPPFLRGRGTFTSRLFSVLALR